MTFHVTYVSGRKSRVTVPAGAVEDWLRLAYRNPLVASLTVDRP